MKFRKAVLSALIAAAASAAAADQASPRLIGRFFSEKSSREEHRLGIAAFADIDLSGESEDSLELAGEIRVDCLHPNAPKDAAWMKKICNGSFSIAGTDGKYMQVAPMGCGFGVLAGCDKAGEWFPVSLKIPLSQLKGSRITKLELFMYNDTAAYAQHADDGNKWNNGSGIKLRARNFRVQSVR